VKKPKRKIKSKSKSKSKSKKTKSKKTKAKSKTKSKKTKSKAKKTKSKAKKYTEREIYLGKNLSGSAFFKLIDKLEKKGNKYSTTLPIDYNPYMKRRMEMLLSIHSPFRN
jgi:hypothetical protein